MSKGKGKSNGSYERKSIAYTKFDEMDVNDPLMVELDKRRPFNSRDFKPKSMFPDKTMY